ncbi:unnamed protein product [Adineta steineri]|uniref:G-protein coupled receptors family 1 profile domain-containing protein n=1 Tax=Adineta steineri TaxID=433720 RepID=A0A819J3R7_9BILA|nr:unnamed protein product [Adineta steineri]CAF3926265.1 unnamed protein product [Adineta steineri]
MASLSPSSILQFSTQYSLYSNCITCVAGLIGNTLNILVFTKLKLFRNNQCILYLTVESIFNFINDLTVIIVNIVSSIYGDSAINQSSIWCRLRYIIFPLTILVPTSMICFAACDQFFSTNYRLNLRQSCTFKLGRYLVFLSIFMSLCHTILFSFSTGIQPLIGCSIINPIWIEYATYFYYPILTGLLPIFITSLFSFLAYQNVRRVVRRQIPIERRRLDHQITAMVLTRAVCFVIFMLPYTIYRIYSININGKQIDMLRSAIERLIQTVFYSFLNLNSSFDFYLFFIISARYRRQVKYALKKKYWRQIKNFSCCRQENQVCPEITRYSDEHLELE